MELLNITDIPDFRTLSYRSMRMDWHYINSAIIDIINPENDNAAIDSSIVKTCKETTAQRRRRGKKYKDPCSSWGYSTMGYEYGRKVHASIDTDSLIDIPCFLLYGNLSSTIPLLLLVYITGTECEFSNR